MPLSLYEIRAKVDSRLLPQIEKLGTMERNATGADASSADLQLERMCLRDRCSEVFKNVHQALTDLDPSDRDSALSDALRELWSELQRFLSTLPKVWHRHDPLELALQHTTFQCLTIMNTGLQQIGNSSPPLTIDALRSQIDTRLLPLLEEIDCINEGTPWQTERRQKELRDLCHHIAGTATRLMVELSDMPKTKERQSLHDGLKTLHNELTEFLKHLRDFSIPCPSHLLQELHFSLQFYPFITTVEPCDPQNRIRRYLR